MLLKFINGLTKLDDTVTGISFNYSESVSRQLVSLILLRLFNPVECEIVRTVC